MLCIVCSQIIYTHAYKFLISICCFVLGNYGNVPPPGEGDVNSDDKEQQKDEENFESVSFVANRELGFEKQAVIVWLLHYKSGISESSTSLLLVNPP